MWVLRGRIAAIRFQLAGVCMMRGKGLGAGRCEWLDRVHLEGPVRILFFAEGTGQLLQAPQHCYTRFLIQGAAIQPTTGTQAQYCQINEDGILKGDVQ